jgi:hypothetical protein
MENVVPVEINKIVVFISLGWEALPKRGQNCKTPTIRLLA